MHRKAAFITASTLYAINATQKANRAALG
jgi:hypothetical protein